MMQMQQPQQQPKGNIQELWDLLGVEFGDKDVVWQDYKPYRKLSDLPREIIFVDNAQPGNAQAFSGQDEITSQLQQLVLLGPGAIRQRTSSDLQFEKLVTTGLRTGTLDYEAIAASRNPFGGATEPPKYNNTSQNYVIAAHIKGKAKAQAVPMYADDPAAETTAAPSTDVAAPAAATAETPAATPAKKRDEMNVVLVSDIDMLGRQIFALRAQGKDPAAEVNFEFDNVTFVLNTLDDLAGDDRFIEIRKRRAAYRTLEAIEKQTGVFQEEAIAEVTAYNENFDKSVSDAKAQFETELDKVRKDTSLDPRQKRIMIEAIQETGQRRLLAKTDELKRQKDDNIEQAERKAQLEITRIQNRYKFLAVSLPPIPPLVVGLIVFFNRRAREREGVSRNRLRMT